MIKFVVQGNPVAQGRPRFARIGNHVRAYDPATSRSWKEAVRWAVSDAMQGEAIHDWPLEVRMAFWFQRPKSHYGTGKNSGVLRPAAPRMHTSKPDAENCAKLLLDAMNGLVYRDDSQVCRLIIEKIYADDA